jgi:hypothetical protein
MQQQRDWQAQLGEVERVPDYLTPIRTGRKDTAEVNFIRYSLRGYLASGKVQVVEVNEDSQERGTHGEWYRDNTTGEVYGLIHDTERGEYRWEKAPIRELTGEGGDRLLM